MLLLFQQNVLSKVQLHFLRCYASCGTWSRHTLSPLAATLLWQSVTGSWMEMPEKSEVWLHFVTRHLAQQLT